MGTLKFEVPHSLDPAEAKRRTEALLKYWGQKYGVQSQWSGDSATLNGKVMGIQLKATLAITASTVGGEASDPGLLFRDAARKYLTQKFNAYLSPSADLVALGAKDD
jgi:hypothetical protein